MSVLPTPLPFAKSGERSACPWAEPTPAAEQSDLLSKLDEVSRIFTLAAKQLPPRPLDRAVYASQCIVSTGLVAMFDAVCRKKATDDTLPVTTALRGRVESEAFQLSFSSFGNVTFAALSSNFLLETPELALARTRLCAYIESTSSHNVVMDLPSGPKTFRITKQNPTLQFWKKLLEATPGMSVDSEPPSIARAIAHWTEQLDSPDERRREMASENLARMGPGRSNDVAITSNCVVIHL